MQASSPSAVDADVEGDEPLSSPVEASPSLDHSAPEDRAATTGAADAMPPADADVHDEALALEDTFACSGCDERSNGEMRS